MFVDVDLEDVERPAQRTLETLETEEVVLTVESVFVDDRLRLDGELDPHPPLND